MKQKPLALDEIVREDDEIVSKICVFDMKYWETGREEIPGLWFAQQYIGNGKFTSKAVDPSEYRRY